MHKSEQRRRRSKKTIIKVKTLRVQWGLNFFIKTKSEEGAKLST